MGNLPISTTIDVTITRETIFPSREGFNTQLIVTGEVTGPLNAGLRTKSYRSIDEVAADWPVLSEAYIAAQTAFSQKPSADRVKIGFRTLANPVVSELGLIQAVDSDWYALTFTKEVRDSADVTAVAAWIEARVKLYMSATNDIDTEAPANVTNVSYLLQQSGYDRSGTFYHTDVDLYPDCALFSRLLSTNLNTPNSMLTMKYKRLIGITPVAINSGTLQQITGFVPGTGLVESAGYFANTYISVKDTPYMVEGNMASGEFIDTMLFSDWLRDALETETLSRLVTTDKIPYTDRGAQNLVEGVDNVLQQGVSNNGIAADTDPDTGELLPAYSISVQRVLDVPASQRANRVAPDIQFIARLAGAFHYSTITGRLTV